MVPFYLFDTNFNEFSIVCLVRLYTFFKNSDFIGEWQLNTKILHNNKDRNAIGCRMYVVLNPLMMVFA
jgi:hypothetical protein